MWKLKVTNKVKLLLWRACTDSLPTMSNLFKKNIVPDCTCYLCMKESETILHTLWTCEKIRQVWLNEFHDLHNSGQSITLFVELVDVVQVRHRNLGLFAMICWSIWNRQNKSRMGEHVVPLDPLFEFAGKLLAEFQQAQKVSPKPVRSTRPRWKRPDLGKL